jgi:hypothetical protein
MPVMYCCSSSKASRSKTWDWALIWLLGTNIKLKKAGVKYWFGVSFLIYHLLRHVTCLATRGAAAAAARWEPKAVRRERAGQPRTRQQASKVFTLTCTLGNAFDASKSITWASGRGLGPGILDFLGPVKCHRFYKKNLSFLSRFFGSVLRYILSQPFCRFFLYFNRIFTSLFTDKKS